MKQTIDKEVYHLFLSAFQTFSEPARLAESELCNSCLVTDLGNKQPDLLPHQALKQTFAETLNILEKEQADSADLLRGRFWEGLQIEEMIAMDRPRPMGKRSFSNHQRDAIRAFAFLFQQRDANCIENRENRVRVTDEVVVVKPADLIETKKRDGKSQKNRLVWFVPLILIGLVGSMFVRWINRPGVWIPDDLGAVDMVDDRTRGEVSWLLGTGDDNRLDKFEWSRPEDKFNVAWMQKGEDYSAVYFDVETSNGFREFKFIPEDDGPTFTDERYQVGMGVNSRDGDWHLYDYDLQAIAADLEPAISLEKMLAFRIKTAGEVWVDKVEFSEGSPSSIAPNISLLDGVAQSGEMTAGTWHYYKIAVPGDASKLTVRLEEMTADLDLYVRRNVRPNGIMDEEGVSDCHSPNNGLHNDVCVLNQVRESVWYIGVHGHKFEGTGTYTINADYAQPPDLAQPWTKKIGEGTIRVEMDPEQGEVTYLQGNGNENVFDLFSLLSAVGETEFNVSWKLKSLDYVAVYVEVDTMVRGERTFKFSPDDKAAVFENGNRYKVGTPDANRNGEWHTYTYDLQAMADQLDPGVVLDKVTEFSVGLHGETWVGDVTFDDADAPP